MRPACSFLSFRYMCREGRNGARVLDDRDKSQFIEASERAMGAEKISLANC